MCDTSNTPLFKWMSFVSGCSLSTEYMFVIPIFCISEWHVLLTTVCFSKQICPLFLSPYIMRLHYPFHYIVTNEMTIHLYVLRSWNMGFAVICKATWLSHNNCAGFVCLKPSSSNSPLIQIVSATAASIALYLPRLKIRTLFCFFTFHKIKESPILTQYLVIDFLVMDHKRPWYKQTRGESFALPGPWTPFYVSNYSKSIIIMRCLRFVHGLTQMLHNICDIWSCDSDITIFPQVFYKAPHHQEADLNHPFHINHHILSL